MNRSTITAIFFLCVTPWALADIVFLGDESRLELIRQCGPDCSAGEFAILTPDPGMAASEIATFAMDASHGVIVVDATIGPLPVVREHVLIARQAGVPGLSILFTNVAGLVTLSDATELLEMEVTEVREVLNLYEMEGDSAPVYFDTRAGGLAGFLADATGIDAVLEVLGSIPERPESDVEFFTGRLLSTYLYLLTPEEAAFTSEISQGGVVTFWVNGQRQKARVVSSGLTPGSAGEIQIELAAPIRVGEGSRSLLENRGQIVAAGVVTRVR